MNNYTIDFIFKITKGTLLRVAHHEPILHLLIDSRKLTQTSNTLFFAIKGSRQNGHQYIDLLYNKGVRNFIIEEEIDLLNFPLANFIKVKNSIDALQQITAFHRQQFQIPIIGVTGSNGKTVVKEWLYQLLEQDVKIVRSPKSYNSQIGVPLSVWQINETHQLGIFEAGISQPYEMQNLEKIIKPTIGVFTNIGEAHSEGFLNIRQKINEKLQLFAFSKHIIYCKDYEELHNAAVNFKSKIANDGDAERFNLFSWSFKNEADLKINEIINESMKSTIYATFKENEISIIIPFSDKASIENAIHCWAYMLLSNYENTIIQQRMLHLTNIGMRLELKEANNNCSLINDSYNSDINSISIALDFLYHQKQHDKHTVILSDILQSGKSDYDLYNEVIELIKAKHINRFIGIGKNICRQQKQFAQIENLELHFYPDTINFVQDFDLQLFNNEAILLKGARAFEFEKISQLLEKKAHETVLEINLSALVHNFKTYQAMLKPKTKIMVMVKAFSYGSGSYEIANVLQFHHADYLAVAYADEGVELRNNGILLPIMVMCPEQRSFDTIIKNRLEPEIYSLEILQDLIDTLQKFYVGYDLLPIPIHLKLDTGMRRLGFEENELDKLLQLINEHKNFIQVKSVFSHLSASESNEHDEFTNYQFSLFEKMTAKIESKIGYKFLKHILNSGGIVRHNSYQMDMVRLGIGLYGYDSAIEMQSKLKTVSTLKTTVLQVKKIKADETIGYSRKGKLSSEGKIATVGIGYADGYRRVLGNGRSKMMVKGELANTVGNICMDMCMLDVSHIANIKAGDLVTVFGENPKLTELAEWEGSIPYEILTGISKRVKRIYFEE
jgi:alanine racemase